MILDPENFMPALALPEMPDATLELSSRTPTPAVDVFFLAFTFLLAMPSRSPQSVTHPAVCRNPLPQIRPNPLALDFPKSARPNPSSHNRPPRLSPRCPESPKPGEFQSKPIAARRNRPSAARRNRSDPVAYPLRSPPGIDSGCYPPTPPDKTEPRAAPAKYLPPVTTICPPGVESGIKGNSKDLRALSSKAGVDIDPSTNKKDLRALLSKTWVDGGSQWKWKGLGVLLAIAFEESNSVPSGFENLVPVRTPLGQLVDNMVEDAKAEEEENEHVGEGTHLLE